MNLLTKNPLLILLLCLVNLPMSSQGRMTDIKILEDKRSLRIGGVDRGNGGGSLNCAGKYQFLDIVEADEFLDIQMSKRFENAKTLDEANLILSSRLFKISPYIASKFYDLLILFGDNLFIITQENRKSLPPEIYIAFDMVLDLSKEDYVIEDAIKGCSLERVGLNFYSKSVGRSLFYVDSYRFEKLPPAHQLAFIYHELLIQAGPTEDSKFFIRAIIAVLFSDHLLSYTENQLIDMLMQAGIEFSEQ